MQGRCHNKGKKGSNECGFGVGKRRCKIRTREGVMIVVGGG